MKFEITHSLDKMDEPEIERVSRQLRTHQRSRVSLHQLRSAIRKPFAWIWNYPKQLLGYLGTIGSILILVIFVGTSILLLLCQEAIQDAGTTRTGHPRPLHGRRNGIELKTTTTNVIDDLSKIHHANAGDDLGIQPNDTKNHRRIRRRDASTE